MKIAVSGKGGSGKTTVSGTLSRSLASDGYDVLAIDDDDNPNLSFTLGVPRDTEAPPLPGDLLTRVETPDGDSELQLTKTPGEIVEDHAIEAPDGVKLLKVGEVEAGSGCFCGSHATARQVLESVVEARDEVTVVDMVAGLEHLGISTAKDVDVMLVVVEPYYKSLETGRKTLELARELDIPEVRVIANKIRDDQDMDAVESYCAEHGIPIDAVVPDDAAIREADHEGIAPFDHDPDAEAVQAIRGVGDALLEDHGRPRKPAEPTE